MGTRADFYIEEESGLHWIGSVAWDGYPTGFPELESFEEQDSFLEWFRERIQSRDDYTAPSMGWPWPWNDSATTDYAYKFVPGDRVYVAHFGDGWINLDDWDNVEDWEAMGKPDFPDMEDRKDTALGERSGIMRVGYQGDEEE